MNYLSHIQLAHASNTSLLGNFLGDFVKGSDLSRFPRDIQTGIHLHRSIDSFTDSHEIIRDLRATFPKPIRRMSGVVIDIYFDHLLFNHWHLYEKYSLDTILGRFYKDLEETTLKIDGRFLKVKDGLISYQWLSDYQFIHAVDRAFKQIENRLQYKIIFAEQASLHLAKSQEQMTNAFQALYPELVIFAKEEAYKLSNQ